MVTKTPFTRHYPTLVQQLDGLAPLDPLLATEICATLTLDEDELLFYSIMAISHALRDGHSCLQLQAVAGAPYWQSGNGQKPGYHFPPLEPWCHHLQQLPLSAEAGHPIVFEHQRLYLRRYWHFEQELAIALQAMLSHPVAIDIDAATAVLGGLFPTTEGTDPDWQQLAVANALGRRFSIIAGGPGTGKTYTVTKLLAAQQQLAPQPLRIALVAPTGKAAQRLSESIIKAKGLLQQQGLAAGLLALIPEQAATLHRLLGVRPDSPNFRHHQHHPLEFDLVVVDEVSMIDLPMMARLLRALPAEAALILLGDADQLPSVAAGSILADLAPRPHAGYSEASCQRLQQLTGYRVEHSTAPLDHLTLLQQSRRFSGSGGIGQLASQVIRGDATQSWQALVSGSRETLLIQGQPLAQWIQQLVVDHYQPLLQTTDIHHAFATLAAFRILTATRVGPQGVEAINQLIEQQLRQMGLITTPGSHYHGRPIMVTENHYGHRLYNGDIGLIWRSETGRLQAAFVGSEGELRWFTPARLPRVESVYAMTIHKTQGSEYGHVALLLPERDSQILSRELLYTAITRASRQLSICSSEAIWQQGVERRVERYSGLALRLQSTRSIE